MTGTKKASFRGGGGFLNDVDGTIVGLKVSTETPFPNADSYFYGTITVKVDGKDAPDSTSLFMGGTEAEFTSVEGNEAAVESVDGRGPSRGTPWADFVNSAEDVDHPGCQADDPNEAIFDYSPLLYSRFRFKQQQLDAAELATLKRKGKPTTRKDKTGKEWPLTKLIVTAYLGQDAPAAPKGKPAAKGAADVSALGAEVLKGILARAPGKAIAVAKLSTPILQAMLKHEQKAQKEVVRKFLMTASNLEGLAGFKYDQETDTVSLA